MEIVSIGYKTTFFGGRMNFYKVTDDNKEYCVVDVDGGMFIDMLWTDENCFVNADLNEKDFIELFKTTPLVDTELQGDEENTFFTQYAPKEPEPIVVNPRDDNKYSGDEVNEILRIFNEFDIVYDNQNEYYTIDQEMFDYSNDEGNTPDLFKKLIGYKVKVKSYGEHKTDGQMVRYKITFKSPEGVKTKIYTDKCLMVGWNYHEDAIIN